MKTLAGTTLTLIVAALMFGGTASASWKPGTPVLIPEDVAGNILEKAVDHAYCVGVPRFGHSGEFPYERFRVFDCSIDTQGKICSNARFAATKGAQAGIATLHLMNRASVRCF